MESLKTPARYYDDNYEDYITGWSRDHLHNGFWYEHTKTHEESLVNQVKEIAEDLQLKPGDVVLDAGCGSGGASRYMVQNYGVKAVGIMLSDTLLQAAKKLSKDIDSSLIEFYEKDYCNTGFEDESFTKIFGMESVCHAPSKAKFIQEAYRLLKKGGMLIVSDSFQKRFDLNPEEKQLFQDWLDGWILPHLASRKSFQADLEAAGFRNIRYKDTTELIRKSSDFMAYAAQKRMEEYNRKEQSGELPLTRYAHNLALLRQKESLDLDIWEHGRFIAVKE